MATPGQRGLRYTYARDEETFADIAQTIQKNIATLQRPGVLSVRPGYKAVGGWVTQKPAIVATVSRKIPNVAADQALPANVGGYAVDVREAGTLERIRAADPERYAQLASSGRHEYELAWALVRSSPKAPEWIYPTAYHIKVAVRDSKVFWLSSGNWNNSNQPDINPLRDTSAKTLKVATASDRDWHVIVEHAGLAKTYEAFLQHDFDVAEQAESKPAPALAFSTQLEM